MGKKGRLVYSTEHGEVCSRCRRPVDACGCLPESEAPPRGDGIVRVRRETKGRKGKAVTTVSGVPLPGKELSKVAKELKKKCGSGGTVKDHVIEIQGDHVDTVMEILEGKGWTVKRSGG